MRGEGNRDRGAGIRGQQLVQNPVACASIRSELAQVNVVLKETKAGARPAFLTFLETQAYVVERGTTAIDVAGTIVPVPVKAQPTSLPPADTGVQAGRFGLICWESVGGFASEGFVGMLT